MKKKILIIQSIILIAVTLLMLSVVSFAWFFNINVNQVQGFNVSVTGNASIDFAFYRKTSSDSIYQKIEPTDGKMVLVDGENMVPGVPILCRIDITNLSSSEIKAGIDFNKINFTVSGELSDKEKVDLVNNFVVQRKSVEFVDSQLSVPAEPPSEDEMSKKENEVLFLQDIIDYTATGFNMISDINISAAPNNMLSVYYRFVLLPDFEGLNGLVFSLTSDEVLFTAKLS